VAQPKVDTVKITVEADGQVIYTGVAPRRTFSGPKKNEGFGAYGRTMLPNGEQLQMSCNLIVLRAKAAK
jgi:hypothetical protein